MKAVAPNPTSLKVLVSLQVAAEGGEDEHHGPLEAGGGRNCFKGSVRLREKLRAWVLSSLATDECRTSTIRRSAEAFNWSGAVGGGGRKGGREIAGGTNN
jgi:hypothetical protein